jgi:hypothetical protein
MQYIPPIRIVHEAPVVHEAVHADGLPGCPR